MSKEHLTDQRAESAVLVAHACRASLACGSACASSQFAVAKARLSLQGSARRVRGACAGRWVPARVRSCWVKALHARRLLESKGEAPVTCTKLETVDEVLKAADVRCSLPPALPLRCAFVGTLGQQFTSNHVSSLSVDQQASTRVGTLQP